MNGSCSGRMIASYLAFLPTGRSFRVRGASIGKLDTSGRIIENRDYYNLAELLTQLGILPTAPSQPA